MFVTVMLEPTVLSTEQAAFALGQILAAQGFFWREAAAGEPSLASVKLYYGAAMHRPAGYHIYLPESSEPLSQLVASSSVEAGGGIPLHWPYDLVRLSFLSLSRHEESLTTARDSRDRFDSAQSLLFAAGVAPRPFLNECWGALDEAIMKVAGARQIPLMRLERWPEGKKWAVGLSHDIDDLGFRDPAFAWRCLRSVPALAERDDRLHALRKGGGTLLQWGRNQLRRQPYGRWYLDEFRQLEAELGFRSTFYFVSSRASQSSYDPNYDIAEPRLAAALAELAEGGWEVGCHGSYLSYDDPQMMQAEYERLKAVLGAAPAGIRQHYLRLRAPETWHHQERAGYEYDASLGFREQLGYRAGLTIPFTPYSEAEKRPLRLGQVPLTVMDGVLFWRHGLAPAAALARLTEVGAQVAGVGGLMTLLWHQNSYEERIRPGWWSVYRDYLTALASRSDVYVAPLASIWRWWQARTKIRIAIIESAEAGVKIRLSPTELTGNLRLGLTGGKGQAKVKAVPLQESQTFYHGNTKIELQVEAA